MMVPAIPADMISTQPCFYCAKVLSEISRGACRTVMLIFRQKSMAGAGELVDCNFTQVAGGVLDALIGLTYHRDHAEASD